MDDSIADEFKQKGNECIREKKYDEAVQQYSEGLRIRPNDHLLYSNRSFAYFNLKQFYYAICDADKVIELKPDFVKGYFRKAEVLKEVYLFDEALINYGRALKLEPTNSIIISNFKMSANLCNREMMLEKNVPWVVSGIGLITGCAIVTLDKFTRIPSITHPFLMVFLVMILSALGWGVGKTYRYYLKIHRKGMIEIPSEMSDDFLLRDVSAVNDENEQQSSKKRARYSKSQARFRMKKAKT